MLAHFAGNPGGGRLRVASTLACVAVVACLAATTSLSAQDAAKTPAETEADVAVQPDAMRSLDKMAAYLRTLKQFKLTATTTAEDVLDDGQKIEIAGQTTFFVKTPDRLMVSVDSDKQQRALYYNGKSVTHVAPALGYYASFDAPETIAKTIIAAEDKFDVRFPLADLFFWNSEVDRDVKVESAYFAGQTQILGERCDHYAFRVDGADVQIWIRAKGDPLPCRMAITDTSDPARPQSSAVLDWDTEADFDEAVFQYSPPESVGRIDQEPVAATVK